MMSLRNRVIGIVILASLLTVIAVSTTAYQSLGQDQRELIVEQERLKAQRLTEQVSQNIRQRILALSAARALFKEDGELRAPAELENRIRGQSYLERFFPGGVLVFDAEDTAVAENTYVPDRIGTNYADRPHFKQLHSSGEPVISRPIMGRTTDVPLLSFLVPIQHNERMLGSVGGIIKLGEESILPTRSERQDTRGGTLSLIIDADNRLYIETPNSNPEQELQSLPPAGENALVDSIMENTSGSAVIDYQGQRYLLATDSVERLNWIFARAVPYELAMAPINASFRQFFTISAAVTVALLVLAWLAARSLTRPLTKATQTINAMAEMPEQTKALPEKGPKEIRDLSHAFNRLSRERQQLDELKNDFISSVSHELRTPLTSIEGSLKMMVAGVSGKLPEKAHSLATIALRNSEQLSSLIRDLLDFNKLAAGRREFQITQCAMDESIQNAIEGNQAMARMYQVHLETRGSTGLTADADPQALRQVLDNLISNAIKHAPAASAVRVEAAPHDQDHVSITVSDKGDGVPESFKDRIFQRFSQAERGTARATAGTGLGLAISKELVRGMGGEIGFYNDQGAHFWITLPSSSVNRHQ
ncbi:MAG: sensor histidine kinase [Halospina sp.]